MILMWTLGGRRFKAESSKSKQPEEDNAETQSPQRFRREDWAAGTGWRRTSINHITRYCNILSSVYFTAIRIACGKLRKGQKAPHANPGVWGTMLPCVR